MARATPRLQCEDRLRSQPPLPLQERGAHYEPDPDKDYPNSNSVDGYGDQLYAAEGRGTRDMRYRLLESSCKNNIRGQDPCSYTYPRVFLL